MQSCAREATAAMKWQAWPFAASRRYLSKSRRSSPTTPITWCIGDEILKICGFLFDVCGSQFMHIVANQQYIRTARSTRPILIEIANRSAIEILYRPFMQEPLYGKSNWLVRGTKFWHVLNPDAFPILDRFVTNSL
jgi:hypothetical protein